MNTFSVLTTGNNLLPIFTTNAYAWQCQHVYGQCRLQGEFNVSLSITTKHTYTYIVKQMHNNFRITRDICKK